MSPDRHGPCTRADEPPRARIVLVGDGRKYACLGRVTRARPGDLRLLDDLLRLQLTAARLGLDLRVVDLDPELRELAELAGVGELFDEADDERA